MDAWCGCICVHGRRSECSECSECSVCIHVKSSHFLHLELLEVGATFLPRCSHDVQEVRREHEGNPLLTDSHEALIVPQDVAEVDVKRFPAGTRRRLVPVFFMFSPKLHV